MNALVITTEYPFPPRNGITIPTANYIEILEKMGFEVEIAVLNLGKATGATIRPYIKLPSRKNKSRALLNEMLFKRPFGCSIEATIKNWHEAVSQRSYDLIIGSPISVLPLTIELREHFPDAVFVAAINDCYTAQLRNAISLSSRLSPTNIVHWLRSFYMGSLEKDLLQGFDYVLVQSAADKAWLERIGLENNRERVLIATNGVAEELFGLKISATAQNVCMFGDYQGRYYREMLDWMYQKVWRQMRESKLKLYIKGKNTELLKSYAQMREDDSVYIVEGFTERLEDLYIGMDILIAPIFRNHGFINKVGESLAAGMLVIGDQTAFNSIPGFQNNVHGLIANSPSEILNGLKYAERNPKSVFEIKNNARSLASSELRWEDRKNIFNHLASTKKAGTRDPRPLSTLQGS